MRTVSIPFRKSQPPEQSLSPCIYNYANKNVVKKKIWFRRFQNVNIIKISSSVICYNTFLYVWCSICKNKPTNYTISPSEFSLKTNNDASYFAKALSHILQFRDFFHQIKPVNSKRYQTRTDISLSKIIKLATFISQFLVFHKAMLWRHSLRSWVFVAILGKSIVITKCEDVFVCLCRKSLVGYRM